MGSCPEPDAALSSCQRAQAAGYRALCLTVDLPVLGQRERDLRNGATIPPKITLRNVVDTVQRIGWLRGVLLDTKITFGKETGGALRVGQYLRFAASGILGVTVATTVFVILSLYVSIPIAKLASIAAGFAVRNPKAVGGAALKVLPSGLVA